MKHVLRFIGTVVVIAVLAVLVLYFLNGQGYIRGPLSTWIDNMQTHLNGAVQDTQETIDEFRGVTEAPTAEPVATPDISGLDDIVVTDSTPEASETTEAVPEG
mgnify:CR=1 FL=1